MRLFKGEFEICYGSLKERNNYARILGALNISPSLNIRNENAKTHFFDKILETNHWPL